MGSEFVEGVLNLRGMAIPIFNLRKFLKMEGIIDPAVMKVAVVKFNSIRVGLVFDSACGIIHPKSEERSYYQYNSGSDNKIISGAIKIESSERLLQILDPQALLALQNIPHLSNDNNKIDEQTVKRSKVSNLKKCITFTCSGIRLGFEITGIHEILTVPEIQKNPWVSDLCMGMTKVRGKVIPVLKFSQLFKRPESDGDPSRRRIIVLNHKQELLGLFVDSVESIGSYSTETLIPIPSFNDNRIDMFSGCVTLNDDSDVFLIDPQLIFANDEILQITHGHAKMYHSENTKSELDKNKIKQVYVSFLIDHRFCLPISEVREVINFTDQIVAAPGSPDPIVGLYSLRGKIVNIADARILYEINSSTDRIKNADKKIIIIEQQDEMVGLLVDSVDNLVSADVATNLALPKVYTDGMKYLIYQDAREVIKDPDLGSVIVLKSDSIFKRIKDAK